MSLKCCLLLLVCGLACVSAYYVSYGLDDDYYNRAYRLASYGYAPSTAYLGRGRGFGGYPSYSRYYPRTGFNTAYYYEDMFKKKK